MKVLDPCRRRDLRPAWVQVDLDAVRHNALVLCSLAHPALLCAVVKADGYGHGATQVARAALAGGASWLAVALVEEGIRLRDDGIDSPILVLSEPPEDAMNAVVEYGLTPTIYSARGVQAASLAAARNGKGAPLGVHVKVDTGMHRVGATAGEVADLASAVVADPHLSLQGLFTHLAVADRVSDPYTDLQLGRFDAVAEDLHARGLRPGILHAGNSAATLWHPRSRYSMVRCGIALYGLNPASTDAALPDLRPSLSLRARVSYVKTLPGGESLSYGLHYRLEHDSVIATVPIGYADGVPRALGASGGEVLVGGRRCRVAGTVTMDQLLVDCGPDASVSRGDEVVLIGAQGEEYVGAEECASCVGTISYEIVCALSGRLPRIYLPTSHANAEHSATGGPAVP